MKQGIVGRKSGMTRIFTESGESLPVTVIELFESRIVQVKTTDTDGYESIQVSFGQKNLKRVAKAQRGHFAKAEVNAGVVLKEFAVTEGQEYQVGQELDLNVINSGSKVDVSGISKGKGFQGGVKRWNFSMQDATHGNSISHRSNGSIGQCQTPGRVFKGKKMSGHMGAKQVTTQNLEVVKVDMDNKAILVKGAVPGANGSYVVVSKSIKTAKQAK